MPAGGGVSFTLGQESRQHYWRVAYRPTEDDKPLEQWVDEIDEYLNQAIAKRLMAEVPIGTMLSGGLDSSLITAIACRQGRRELKTFAVGFNESAFSELDYSRRLAKISAPNIMITLLRHRRHLTQHMGWSATSASLLRFLLR